MVTGKRQAGELRGGTMNRRQDHSSQGAFVRFGHRVAAIVHELNYAQTRLASARNTPERF
jgi:hypothetical protein